MKRMSGRWAIGLLVVLAVLAGPASGALAKEGDIEVVVSPYVLNLESFGGSVSLHTDFTYSLVDDEAEVPVELTVNDEPVLAFATFADDSGHLVVKCDMTTIKEMLKKMIMVPGEASFDLTVLHENGSTYTGTDTITVISQAGVNRKK